MFLHVQFSSFFPIIFSLYFKRFKNVLVNSELGIGLFTECGSLTMRDIKVPEMRRLCNSFYAPRHAFSRSSMYTSSFISSIYVVIKLIPIFAAPVFIPTLQSVWLL